MCYEKNIFLTIWRLYSGMDMGLQFPESQTPAPAAEKGSCSTASETPWASLLPTHSVLLPYGVDSWSLGFLCVCVCVRVRVSSLILHFLPHESNV